MLRLADVDDAPLGILHQIDAGRLRELLHLLARQQLDAFRFRQGPPPWCQSSFRASSFCSIFGVSDRHETGPQPPPCAPARMSETQTKTSKAPMASRIRISAS